MIDLTALQKHIDMLARSPRSNATTLEYLVQCRDEIMRFRNGQRLTKDIRRIKRCPALSGDWPDQSEVG